MALLEVSGLHKSFGGVTAARDVNFVLEAGEMLAIIGPNGAGKSTIFNMAGGQLRPDSGDIIFKGRSLKNLNPREIWQRGVGRTFQIAATFASMTVAENVQMVLLSKNNRLHALVPFAGNLYRDEAQNLLDLVGMAEQADRPCAVLAYGDVKRAELAIALANNPDLLLMDEPTAGMAPAERTALMELTASIVADRNIGVLFTEHDMDVVFGHAKNVIVLDRGEIIARGTPDTVRADPRVQQIYLGSSHG
jgi:branched-chain amino acid transport system ATP-binding protein